MKTKIFAGSAIVLILGYFIATPYITAYQIKSAAENQNAEALAQHIEFRALRNSLRNQMKELLIKELEKDEFKGTQIAQYGTAFGGVMVGKMIDSYVTPDNIANLMRGDKSLADLPIADLINGKTTIEAVMSQDATDSNNASGSAETSSSELLSDASMSYESFGTFTITGVNPKSGEAMRFVLSRQGLISWKLTAVSLPL